MTIHNEAEASTLLITGQASLEDLREIVSSYPQLRPLVAAYPDTDEALLGWLADLGDPQVDKALAARIPIGPAPDLPPSPSLSVSSPTTSQPRKPTKLPRIIGLGVLIIAVALAGVFFIPRLLSASPVLVAGSSNVCMFFPDGTVSCWGNPPFFGPYQDNVRTTPEAVPGLTNAVSGSASSDTCAVHEDHTVSCWGPQFSDIEDENSQTPLTPVSMQITAAVDIAIGVAHFCVVKEDASVSCWGDNLYGQVGDGTDNPDSAMGSTAAVQVVGVSDATAISAGNSHTCVLSKDATVKCWGSNFYGQLGDGSITTRNTATSVAGLAPAIDVAIGAWHTCALGEDRTITCWGKNDSGQLGNGIATSDPSPSPTPVIGLEKIKAIAVGGSHTCAIQRDRTVACWGDNQMGQLGDGTTTDSTSPVQVSDLTNIVGIAAGEDFTCAINKKDQVFCWGDNRSGELGTGNNSSSPVPVEVTGLR